MKDIFASIGKVLGFIFAAIVIGFTAYLTWLLAQKLVPDNTILQLMTLALFDGGALVWFITFLTVAKGTLQWAFAGIGFLIGLAGAIIMAGGELVLGQKLVAVEDPSKIGWILVMTVIIAALAHATLIYAFHFVDPHTKNRIENAQKVSQAIERAYQDARGQIDLNVDKLVEGLVESVVHEARQQIGAATALHIRRAAQLEEKAGETLRDGQVVDGTAKDAGAQTQPHRKKRLTPWLRFVLPAKKNGNGATVKASETVAVTLPGEPVKPPDTVTEMIGDHLVNMPNIKIPLYPDEKKDQPGPTPPPTQK